MLKIKDARL
jgi:hypothetical protein